MRAAMTIVMLLCIVMVFVGSPVSSQPHKDINPYSPYEIRNILAQYVIIVLQTSFNRFKKRRFQNAKIQ